ncbi:quinoprotein dehydrogenase-associated SoxYZ-like carrier [Tropicimonas sp. S265A]|uniref:quinoprotein dehydrogenase-associated SoxYZ-like carrier n=1 Tax=Tropicimonas sp. S265A TaxID=3415134 RepID=UPI003C7B6A86
MSRFVSTFALLGLLAGPAFAIDEVRVPLEDPMKSGMWSYHQKHLLDDPEAIQFDDRVVLHAPKVAEDTVNVPLLVDATALDQKVVKMVISADYGPIPHIMTYYPDTAAPKISLRFKVDQGTAIRASVQTEDGVWHVGSTYIDAAGGGCSAPAVAYANADWYDRLGEMHGRIFAGSDRARMIVDHPMDTGLAGDIPVFIIEGLALTDDAGTQVAHMDLYEPVNEDPAFTFYFEDDATPNVLHVAGRDNNGNRIKGTLTTSETH